MPPSAATSRRDAGLGLTGRSAIKLSGKLKLKSDNFMSSTCPKSFVTSRSIHYLEGDTGGFWRKISRNAPGVKIDSGFTTTSGAVACPRIL